MILSLTKSLLCFGIVHWFFFIFGGQYGIVLVYHINTGLCKTWTLDWTGLCTGLDYGLDWTGLDYTDQNSCIQTANAAKATTAFLQLCLKLLPSLLRHHSSISARSKVTCKIKKQEWTSTVVMDDRGNFLLFSTLQQRLECGFCSKQLLFYPSSEQSVLTRAQSKIGKGAFPTDACGLHKKQ